jgi:transcriptional regulator with XRE-family HTH domain
MGEMLDILILLGKAIRIRREALGFSQERLAELCGFDRTYISLLERGKRNPSLLNISRLSDGLGTSVSELTEVLNGSKANRRSARASDPSRNTGKKKGA